MQSNDVLCSGNARIGFDTLRVVREMLGGAGPVAAKADGSAVQSKGTAQVSMAWQGQGIA